jgi:hypothetical protein
VEAKLSADVVFTKVDGLIDHPAGNANVDRVVFKHFPSGAILRDAEKTPLRMTSETLEPHGEERGRAARLEP